MNDSHLLDITMIKTLLCFRPESLFFLVLYVVYCVAMAFNSNIEMEVKRRVKVPESWNVSQVNGSRDAFSFNNI